LLTQLILPILEATAANPAASLGSTRVILKSSNVIEKAPKGGINLEDLVTPPEDPHVRAPNHSFHHIQTKINNTQFNYTVSKVGNLFLASELSHVAKPKNILSLTQNPGNLKTAMSKKHSWIGYHIIRILYEPIFGAYTELWAGLRMFLGLATWESSEARKRLPTFETV